MTDVLLVSLGTTFGLRAADDQLATELRALGVTVELVRPQPPREVRTLMLTDLMQAAAAARATRAALGRTRPRAIIYSSTTAATFWPQPGAIRFDALAQVTRPGRHGLWQRRLERRRLAEATVLLPWADGSLEGAPPAALARPRVVLPVAITPPAAAAPSGGAPAIGTDRIVAVTYGADVAKKGLDRTLAAWARVRRPGELLAVAGRDDLPAGPADGVTLSGRLEPADFRALVREAGVLVMAPRREDYGLVQLEALAEGARVVTCRAPGPYAALPLIEQLWPQQVVADGDDASALGAALRGAIDAQGAHPDAGRAIGAVAPWRPETVREQVAHELLPALGL